jgi:hypothetical protein
LICKFVKLKPNLYYIFVGVCDVMVDRVSAFVDDASARAFRQQVFDDVDVLLLDGQHQRGATLDVDGVQISESI